MCRKINAFIPLLFISYVLSSLLFSAIVAASGIKLPVAASYFISEGLLLLPALIYVWAADNDIIKRIPYKRLSVKDTVTSLLIGACLIPLTIFISNFSMLFSENYLNDSTAGLFEYPYLVQLFLIAVLPAVVEEFVFRGVIYHSYQKNGVLGGAVLSGLIFGLIHLNINQLSYALVMGIIFALMVEVTGSMFSSMLAHFAINSYSITVFALMRLFSNEAALAADTAVITDYPLPVIIAQLCMLGAVAAGFLLLAYVLFKKMAMRNGRWESLKAQLKRGFKPQNDEYFLTIPLLATIFMALIFMIYMEVV